MEKAPAYSEIVEVKEVPPTKETKESTYYDANTAERQPVVTQVYTSGFGGSSFGNTGKGICACTCLTICICFCVTFIVIAAVLGGVFGYWASHCFKNDFMKTEKFVDNLGYPIEELEIFTSGNINFMEVQSGSASIYIVANISSGSESNLDKIDMSVDYVTEFSRSFEFAAADLWWYCSRADLEATFDSSNINNDIKVELATSSGDISFNNLNNSMIRNLKIESLSGDVLSHNMYSSDISIEVVSGSISLDNVESSKLSVTSNSGNINLGSFISQDVNIEASAGDISTYGTLLHTSNNNECKYTIKSSSGSVNIDMLDFQSSLNCNVVLRLTSGNARVTLKNFSGSYRLSTTSGNVSINGQSHNGLQEGTVAGSSSHYLEIKSLSGDISVNF